MNEGIDNLADSAYQESRTCVVVTIHEQMPMHPDEVDAMVFWDWEKATAWIESQIDTHVSEFGLDRESDVDGWNVRLDGDAHTIQYAAQKRRIL